MWLSVLVFIKIYSCLKCHFNEKRKLSKRLLHFNNCLWIILVPFSLVRITLSQVMTKEASKCLVLKINSKYFILYNSKLNPRIFFSVSGLDRLTVSRLLHPRRSCVTLLHLVNTMKKVHFGAREMAKGLRMLIVFCRESKFSFQHPCNRSQSMEATFLDIVMSSSGFCENCTYMHASKKSK